MKYDASYSKLDSFFHQDNQNTPINQSSVGYLDCLMHQLPISTVYHMMERALRIKSQLNVESIVCCVHDQAIYAKAYQIKCKDPTKFKNIFLMMGTFHIIRHSLRL